MLKDSGLFQECRGGLRHHWNNQSLPPKQTSVKGWQPCHGPMGSLGGGTLSHAQCLLNPVVVFLTCPESLNYCCSKHTTTLLPSKLDKKHLLGLGSSPPSWLGITPTIRFLAFIFPQKKLKTSKQHIFCTLLHMAGTKVWESTQLFSPHSEARIACPVPSRLRN